MDMPTEKKLKVSFTYEHSEDSVKLVGSPNCCELPEISAAIFPMNCENSWFIAVSDTTNKKEILGGYCFRGKAFDMKIAREIIRGCYSRLGKHRRHTANKAKKGGAA